MTSFGSDLILARLQGLHPKRIDLSLERLERLLAALGHPERRLPPVVHAAGTNGKGSTLALLDAMLTASGKTVHRYISPHLVHFNERIRICGEPIEEALLAEVLDVCERANGDAPITFFEITTAAAFIAFGKIPADWLLLETGLGGRLDATNVVERPELTLITPISMDHEAFLGDTIEAIAAEKAGIIKRDVPVLVGPQAPSALAVLDAKAKAMSAPLQAAGRDWHFAEQAGGFRVDMPNAEPLTLPQPLLQGQHQIMNAALAAAAGAALGLEPRAIAAGIAQAEWPARLQRLDFSGDSQVKQSAQHEIWLDGGHNPAAGEALAMSLPGLADGRPVDLVVGMLETKNVQAFLAPMRPHVRRLYAVPVPNEPAGRTAEDIATNAAAVGIDATPVTGFVEALQLIEAARGAERSVTLICGSLYFAGQVLRRVG